MAFTVYECAASNFISSGGGNTGTALFVKVGNFRVFSSDTSLRGLFRFDMTSFPSRWRRARLQLTIESMDIQEATRFYPQKVTQPAWTELGSTWIKYDGSNNWATLGGDVTGGAVDVGLVNPGDTKLILDVRPWGIDAEGGMLNLLVHAEVEGTGGVDRWVAFHSSRATNPLDRPLLVLEDYPSQTLDTFFW